MKLDFILNIFLFIRMIGSLGNIKVHKEILCTFIDIKNLMCFHFSILEYFSMPML